MTRSDLTDLRVLTIASEVHDDPSLGARSVVDVLADDGVPTHYTVAALDDLYRRGLVDYGSRMDFAWPTSAGRALLAAEAAAAAAAATLAGEKDGVPEHEQRRARSVVIAASAVSTAAPVCGVGGCLTCPEAA